jgi:hypothetical protein
VGAADPVDTLSRLGSHLAAGSSPQQWLDTLRAALGVPAVALLAESAPSSPRRVSRPTGRKTAGPVAPSWSSLVGSQHVGDLVVTLHPDRTELPSTTQAVLRLVAGPLAQALHATRLAEELQASRGRVVAALERSAAGFDGTCTTGSAPPSPGSRTAPMPRRTFCGRTSTRRPGCCTT